jgi:hypothetical protein
MSVDLIVPQQLRLAAPHPGPLGWRRVHGGWRWCRVGVGGGGGGCSYCDGV